MKKILSLYKFKTPFFDIEKEKTNLDSLKNRISLFFSSFWVDMNFEIIETEIYKNISFKSNEWIILNIWFNKYYNNNYFPILFIDLYLDEDLMKNIDLDNFLQLFFEIFPVINESDIILENNLDFPILSNFLDIEKLIKKYNKTENIWWILQEFINNKDINNFYKIKEVFLFFNALMFENFKNIRKMEKSIKENIEISNKFKWDTILEANLDFSNKRLNNLLVINTETFKKYTIMLEEFYKLFNIKWNI